MDGTFHNAVRHCTLHEMTLADEKKLLNKFTEEKREILTGVSFWIPLTRHFLLRTGRIYLFTQLRSSKEV